MKKKVLLDTNMLIYLHDDNILDEKVAKITKYLYDSDEYEIVIHPLTLREIQNIKDAKKREWMKSKLQVYTVIENPPRATEIFNKTAGCKNLHDKIDNELLFAVKSNCVSYLISNDKEVCKKAQKLDLNDSILSIEQAVAKFSKAKPIIINTPVFITEEFLYNMNLEDEFFLSLREDYKGFDEWFMKKSKDWKKAYVTKSPEGKITSFLMLKDEDESEDYSKFETPFQPAKRIKVSTFKVDDRGKKIGESFIKIMIDEALQKDVDEIYVTTFERQEALIYLIKQFGFKRITYKNTTKKDGSVEKEAIFVKNMRDKSQYPFVQVKSQSTFIFPVIPKYHKLLFEEAEGEYQIAFEDTIGMNTSSNAIKKAFISNAKIKLVKPGDIILFYASHDKKAITALGIVDTTWNKFESVQEIIDIVKKRTAYNEFELKSVAHLDSLVILFKHFLTFKNPITYEWLIKQNIIKGMIQGPIHIGVDSLKKIVVQGNMESMVDFL